MAALSNFDELKQKLIEIEKVESEGLPEAHCGIGVGSFLPPENVLSASINNNIYHVVQSDRQDFEEETLASEVIQKKSENFLENPISSILCPTDPSTEKENEMTHFSFSFSSMNQKEEVLGQLHESLGSLRMTENCRREILLVCDELFTNVIFNAPFPPKDIGEAGISRADISTTLEKPHSGRIFCGHDEKRLVIGCEDTYGSLNVKRQINRLKDCIEQGLDQHINLDKKDGAGIGLFLVFKAACSFYAVVDKNKKTSLAAVFPIGISDRVRNAFSKNLHCYDSTLKN